MTGATTTLTRTEYQQFMARHPQVGQREQGLNLLSDLGRSPVANRHVPELLLDHSEGGIHLVADAGPDLPKLVGEPFRQLGLIQRFALSGAHRHVPGLALGRVGPLVGTLITRVTEDISLLAMEQAVTLGDLAAFVIRPSYGMHQTGVRMHPDVRLHPEVLLTLLLGLVHFGVGLAGLVLRRVRCADQCGVHHRAGLEHQAFTPQHLVDRGQNLICQLLVFRAVSKTQVRGLIRTPLTHRQARKLTKQRHVIQSLLHGRITHRDPLLHEVNAQHRKIG
jgi:hypothetical protein